MPHIEFTREIARRFNHMFGREPGFEQKAEQAIKKLGSRRARLYRELRTKFQEQGDAGALEAARIAGRGRKTSRWAIASGSSAISKAAGK